MVVDGDVLDELRERLTDIVQSRIEINYLRFGGGLFLHVVQEIRQSP